MARAMIPTSRPSILLLFSNAADGYYLRRQNRTYQTSFFFLQLYYQFFAHDWDPRSFRLGSRGVWPGSKTNLMHFFLQWGYSGPFSFFSRLLQLGIIRCLVYVQHGFQSCPFLLKVTLMILSFPLFPMRHSVRKLVKKVPKNI